MARTQWQYCQIELSSDDTGILKQFFSDRRPVETMLHQNWPAMIAKLGEQGWEMISVLPHSGGLGRRPLTYVFKRSMGTAAPASASPGTVMQPRQAAEPPAPPQPEPADEEPGGGFEPLRGI